MSRTTIDLDPLVLRQLKERQREEGKTLGELASELLARALSDTGTSTAAPSLQWVAADLEPLVDVDDKEALAGALGDNEPR